MKGPFGGKACKSRCDASKHDAQQRFVKYDSLTSILLTYFSRQFNFTNLAVRSRTINIFFYLERGEFTTDENG